MMELGVEAPRFRCPTAAARRFRWPIAPTPRQLLVIFMCNHCPYVKHVADGLSKLAVEYQRRGVAVVGINSNDVQNYPDDNAPDKMLEEAKRRGYTFPYLYDQTQEVAEEYHAACTPDFFVFDHQRRLVYRGQMDGSRPGNNVPVTGQDLRTALDAVLAGKPVSPNQKPSLGCNIKWRPGNGPDYWVAGGRKLNRRQPAGGAAIALTYSGNGKVGGCDIQRPVRTTIAERIEHVGEAVLSVVNNGWDHVTDQPRFSASPCSNCESQ